MDQVQITSRNAGFGCFRGLEDGRRKRHELRLTDKLTEEEAWLFLTDASETLLALGVDILLPSWWQAMKSASLKVKATLKGTVEPPAVVCRLAGDA